MSDFIVVKEGAEGIYEEKKSQFIAKVYPVNNEEQVVKYIEAAKKKYWDARHNCHAFVIGDNNEITRCSDDGEPSGTAGKPILEVIMRSGLHNCLIIVTRYFGGTLLGTGGLVRAYTQSAKEAVSNSILAKRVPGEKYIVTMDYNGIGKIQNVTSGLGAVISDTEYTDKVVINILVEKAKSTELVTKLTEITNGRAAIEKDCDLPIESDFTL